MLCSFPLSMLLCCSCIPVPPFYPSLRHSFYASISRGFLSHSSCVCRRNNTKPAVQRSIVLPVFMGDGGDGGGVVKLCASNALCRTCENFYSAKLWKFLHIPDEKLNYRKFHNIHNSSSLNKFLVTEFIQVKRSKHLR